MHRRSWNRTLYHAHQTSALSQPAPLQVCGELARMVEAVDDFRQFLGPELQAVTGDRGVIQEIQLMVQVGQGLCV